MNAQKFAETILTPFDIFNESDLNSSSNNNVTYYPYQAQEANNSSILRNLNTNINYPLWTNDTNNFNWTSLLNTYVFNNTNTSQNYNTNVVADQQNAYTSGYVNNQTPLYNHQPVQSYETARNLSDMTNGRNKQYSHKRNNSKSYNNENKKENHIASFTPSVHYNHKSEIKFQRSFAEVVAKATKQSGNNSNSNNAQKSNKTNGNSKHVPLYSCNSLDSIGNTNVASLKPLQKSESARSNDVPSKKCSNEMFTFPTTRSAKQQHQNDKHKSKSLELSDQSFEYIEIKANLKEIKPCSKYGLDFFDDHGKDLKLHSDAIMQASCRDSDSGSKQSQNKKRRIKRKNSNDDEKKSKSSDSDTFDSPINDTKSRQQQQQKLNTRKPSTKLTTPPITVTQTCAVVGKNLNKPSTDAFNSILNRDSIIIDIKSCLNEISANTYDKIKTVFYVILIFFALLISSIVNGIVSSVVFLCKTIINKIETIKYFIYDVMWMRFYSFLLKVFHLRKTTCSLKHSNSDLFENNCVHRQNSTGFNSKRSVDSQISLNDTNNIRNSIEKQRLSYLKMNGHVQREEQIFFENFDEFGDIGADVTVNSSLCRNFIRKLRKVFGVNLPNGPNAEPLVHESIGEMLQKIDDNLENTKNMLFCLNCTCLHRRYETKRPVNVARFCKQCSTYHDAKENDLWIECSYFGLKQRYYMLTNNKVYDVTEWLKCRASELDFIKENAHQIKCKMIMEEKKNDLNELTRRGSLSTSNCNGCNAQKSQNEYEPDFYF